jgi:hypothetical protein
MGSSILAAALPAIAAPNGAGPGKNTGDLVQMQKMIRDFAEARRTPFGTVVPKIAVPVFAFGQAQVPAYGTQALIATYTTRANWVSLICGLVLQYTGAGPAPNPTDVTYVVDVDRPLGTTEGYSEKDFGAFPWTLGSFTNLVWPVEFRHNNGEVLRIKATPNANMGIGVGNFFVGALVGFEWPEQGWEAY